MGVSLQAALARGPAFARISQFHPELTAFRRDLHANPELGFEEVYTARRVAEMLQLCGVTASTPASAKQVSWLWCTDKVARLPTPAA